MGLGTILSVESLQIISTLAAIAAIVGFIFAWNQYIKKTINKDDLTDLKNYVDQQDRGLHHRVDHMEVRLNSDLSQIRETIDKIYSLLITKKK
jgi:hypothetical protein